ncbi:hypothetical protein V491_02879, partial [Pseudogymnoascus sp. VKM F-3775]
MTLNIYTNTPKNHTLYSASTLHTPFSPPKNPLPSTSSTSSPQNSRSHFAEAASAEAAVLHPAAAAAGYLASPVAVLASPVQPAAVPDPVAA